MAWTLPAAMAVMGSLVMGSVSPGAVGISLDTISTTFTFDRSNNFGWRFTPGRDIDVRELGFFDAASLPGGSGTGLVLAHDVGIFRVSDQALLAQTNVPAGTAGTLTGHFRYAPLAAPLRLSAGVTYLVAGFTVSASPDPAAAVTAWSLPPDITFANSPAPTSTSLTTGTSMYITSAGHGGGVPPPSGLAYAGLAVSSVLPTFAANFEYTPAGTCSSDFNGDGDTGTDADIEAFFACLAGNCCAACGSADFNGDGDLGTDADIEAFFRVLAGGSC